MTEAAPDMGDLISRPEILTFHPLTPDRWGDLDALFDKHGAAGGCWCMWWRIKRAEFNQNKNVGNKKAFKALVDSGKVPGILAYRDELPIGWCSIAPREQYGALERSRVLHRIDDKPVWSIVCFYITRSEQGKRVASALVQAAVEYARRMGARIVEAYPTVPRGRELPPVSSFMGRPAIFEAAGFSTVSQPTQVRLIMRIDI